MLALPLQDALGFGCQGPWSHTFARHDHRTDCAVGVKEKAVDTSLAAVAIGLCQRTTVVYDVVFILAGILDD